MEILGRVGRFEVLDLLRSRSRTKLIVPYMIAASIAIHKVFIFLAKRCKHARLFPAIPQEAGFRR
jgi:hypothetical protein